MIFRHSYLQLVLGRSANTLHQRPPVAEAHLAALDLRLEPHLLPVALPRARPPRARDELVARAHGAREARLVLADVGRVVAAEGLEELVAGAVPRMEPVINLLA